MTGKPPSPLTILHIDTGTAFRGGQQQLLYLAQALAERGHRQTLAGPEDGALESRCGKGLEFFPFPSHDVGHLFGVIQLRRLIQDRPFDIIHAHDGRGHTVGLLAAWGRKIKHVATRRVLYTNQNRWVAQFKYQRCADALIVVSEAVKRKALESGIAPDNIHLIYDGVKFPVRLPDTEQRRMLREHWGLTERDVAVGHVGYFSPEKGQVVLARAARLLQTQWPDLRFFLAGEGPAQFQAAFLAECGENLRWIGFVEDLGSFLAALDLFVMPSISEGLGSSALLAMAYGLPVVASQVGGLPEVVIPQETGWLVEPDSPRQLADLIADAVRDRERLMQMGQQGRRRVQSLFSCRTMVDKTENLYRSLLAKESR